MSPRIRLATPHDADSVLAVYRPVVEGTIVSFELEVPDPGEIAARIERTLAHAPWLVCEDRGALLGYAYAVPFRRRPAYAWTLESSVYVHPRHLRRGVARALYTSLLACLRLQGFHRLVAGIALPNEASVALHEGLGFAAVGTFSAVGHKFEDWHAVGFWELELQALPSPPPPPLTVDEARGSDAWRAALESGLTLLADGL